MTFSVPTTLRHLSVDLHFLPSQMTVYHARAPHRHSQPCCFLSVPVDYLSSSVCGIEIVDDPGHGTLAVGAARYSWPEVAIWTLRGSFPVVVVPQAVSIVHCPLD